MEISVKYTCPCCGYRTFDEPAKGTYDICGLCGWEDDLVQNEDPDYEGGANGICLRKAQHEFLKETAETEGFLRDQGWQLLEPPSEESRLENSKTDFVATSNGDLKNA
nr:CPCC family cysteine-rich protein [Marinobacter nauticus]